MSDSLNLQEEEEEEEKKEEKKEDGATSKENPDNTYYILKNGQKKGPYGAKQISQMLDEYRLIFTDLCSQDGGKTWSKLSEYEVFDRRTKSRSETNPPPPTPEHQHFSSSSKDVAKGLKTPGPSELTTDAIAGLIYMRQLKSGKAKRILESEREIVLQGKTKGHSMGRKRMYFTFFFLSLIGMAAAFLVYENKEGPSSPPQVSKASKTTSPTSSLSDDKKVKAKQKVKAKAKARAAKIKLKARTRARARTRAKTKSWRESNPRRKERSRFKKRPTTWQSRRRDKNEEFWPPDGGGPEEVEGYSFPRENGKVIKKTRYRRRRRGDRRYEEDDEYNDDLDDEDDLRGANFPPNSLPSRRERPPIPEDWPQE